MRKKMSMSAKIRRMIEGGRTNKEIIDKLKVKPGLVYNVRYHVEKAKREGTGINAPAVVATPTAPKKRGRPRKNPLPDPKDIVPANYRSTPPGAVKQVPYESLIPTQSRSLWERVKDWLLCRV